MTECHGRQALGGAELSPCVQCSFRRPANFPTTLQFRTYLKFPHRDM